MPSNPTAFQEAAEMASQLTPQEQLQLVVSIGQQLSAALPAAPSEQPRPGTPAAILQAVLAPPHLHAEDVDELDRIIAAGRQPVAVRGVFDTGAEG